MHHLQLIRISVIGAGRTAKHPVCSPRAPPPICSVVLEAEGTTVKIEMPWCVPSAPPTKFLCYCGRRARDHQIVLLWWVPGTPLPNSFTAVGAERTIADLLRRDKYLTAPPPKKYFPRAVVDLPNWDRIFKGTCWYVDIICVQTNTW